MVVNLDTVAFDKPVRRTNSEFESAALSDPKARKTCKPRSTVRRVEGDLWEGDVDDLLTLNCLPLELPMQ